MERIVLLAKQVLRRLNSELSQFSANLAMDSRAADARELRVGSGEQFSVSCRRFFGALLVHYNLQMRSSDANDSGLSYSKQMKRGEYKQGRMV